MKLFENKVGRPSNEVKKNRRIFVVSMIALGAVLLTLGVSFLVNINSDRLKGAASEKPANTAFDDMNFYKCVIDNYNEQNKTKLSYKTKLTDKQLKSISKLSCHEKNIVSVKGIEKITNLRDLIASYNKITKINISKNIKLENLNLNENKLEQINLNKNINLKVIDLEGNKLRSINLRNNPKLNSLNLSSSLIKYLDLTKNTNLEKLYLYANISVLNLDNNKKLKYLNIVNLDQLRTLNLVQNTSLKTLILSHNSNLEKVYVDKKAHENMISISGGIIKYETDDPTADDEVDCEDCVESAEDYEDYVESAEDYEDYEEYYDDSDKGYQIYNSPNVKIIPIENKLELECPATAFVGEKITCKTNSTKSTIRVSKGGLSDHYLELLNKSSGRFTTPKKVVNLMYTKKGYAKVVAEQNGSNSVTRIIEIKEPLKLSCPSSVKVGKQFTCITNMVGAKISVTKGGLANGYNTSFTTVKRDLTKQSKYTKTGTVTVTVSKSGYKSVSKTVKIVK